MDPARYIVELFARFARASDPKAFGRLAEELSAHYLRLKGYRLRERNWRSRFGEIDLVAEKGDLLVFVEVKARRGREKGGPEEALTPQKREKLLTLARHYLSLYKGRARRVRFDLLAWDLSGPRPRLRHLKGVIEDG
jgi:putative endonuclease